MKSSQIPPGRGMSLWERTLRDPRYLEIKHTIQTRYGLPLDFDIRLEPKKWREWMGMEERSTGEQANRGKAFLKDVQALFKKFQVPDTWQADFIADIAGIASEKTFPRVNLYQDWNGHLKWECIITPETDLTNPAILEWIQSQQKEFAGDSPPPAKGTGPDTEALGQSFIEMELEKRPEESIRGWIKKLWGRLSERTRQI